MFAHSTEPLNPITKDLVEGTDLLTMSYLVLVYRVIPSDLGSHPLLFSNECIVASRQCLESYNVKWEQYKGRRDDGWRSTLSW